MRTLSEQARKQGEWWSQAADDWVAFQEPVFAPLWRAVLDAAGVTGGMRVLDAGCGSGGACGLIAARDAEANGVDVSTNLIAQALSRFPSARFHIGELDDLPFPDGVFDAVVAINALQFAIQPETALGEFARVSKPGGRVTVAVFADPAQCDIGSVFGAIRGLFAKPPSSGGPFALADEAVLRRVFDSCDALHIEAIRAVECEHSYADMEAATRGMMSAGSTGRAVEILGEARVREAVRGVFERLRRPDGTVPLKNRFWIVTARRS